MFKRLMVLAVFLGLPLTASPAEIHEAVRAGDIPRIERLLKQWPKRLDSPDREKSGLAPIQIAALHGDRKVVEFLLDRQPEAGSAVEALRYAVWRGDLELINLFLERGVEARSNLLDSVMNAHEIEESSLIDPDQQTKLLPVTDETRARRLEIARLLIDRGADVNMKMKLTGETPIFFASHWGREMIGLLIAKGADVRVSEIENRASPLHYAAIITEDPAIFQLFKDKNLAIDLRDRFERTPLFWAARKGNLPAVKALVELGADVNAKDMAGWTPLHVAASRGHKEVLQFLLERGAAPNARTNFGWTPVYTAARYDHPTEVRLLIERGVELNIADLDGRTPLTISRNFKAGEPEKLLKDAGAQETAKICQGETCDFESEMRNRLKYFFENPPQKNCVLVHAPSGLFVYDVLPDDFAVIVNDFEMGLIKEQVRFATVVRGRRSAIDSQNGKASIIVIKNDQPIEVFVHYAMTLASDDFDPGHLNRIRFGAGGLCDLIVEHIREESSFMGQMRSMLPSLGDLKLSSSPAPSSPSPPPSFDGPASKNP